MHVREGDFIRKPLFGPCNGPAQEQNPFNELKTQTNSEFSIDNICEEITTQRTSPLKNPESSSFSNGA